MDAKQLSDQVREEYWAAIAEAPNLSELEGLRVAVLGKKGRVSQMLSKLRDLEPKQRQVAGSVFNTLKEELNQAIEVRRSTLEAEQLAARLSTESIDITATVRPETSGTIHPVSQVLDEVTEIQKGLFDGGVAQIQVVPSKI